MSRALLISCLVFASASASAAPAPCDLREKELYVEALTARSPGSLWETEAALVKHRRPADCIEPPPPRVPAAPGRIRVPVDLPKQPEGPGAGPWVFLGLGVALTGGAIVVDALANDVRDDLENAQRQGDRTAFDASVADFESQRWIARGLVAGAAVSALTGVLWLWLGGDDDPVQPRPVFSGHTAGLEVSF